MRENRLTIAAAVMASLPFDAVPYGTRKNARATTGNRARSARNKRARAARKINRKNRR